MTLDEFKALPHDYIGDGAYVCYTGFDFVVITTDCITIHNEVVMDHNAIKVLYNFMENHK